MTITRAAAFGVSALAFAASVHRAASQSITIDEASTYIDFVSTGWDAFFHRYDANNHPLYTLLAKASVALFGLSEFALRLPSLIGAAIFLTSLNRILRRATGDSWWTVLGVALLALNPYMLDFFTAARGYGLGCGLMLASIDAVLRERFHHAGVAMGLAAATNLTFVFPAAGLSAALAAQRKPWIAFTALWILIGAAVESGPVRNATPDQFYFGVQTLRETAETLVRGSVFHGTQGPARPPETVTWPRSSLVERRRSLLAWIAPRSASATWPAYFMFMRGMIMANSSPP